MDLILIIGISLVCLTILVVGILYATSKDCILDGPMECPINGGVVTKGIKQKKSGVFGKCVNPLPKYTCKIGDGKFLTHLYSGCSDCRKYGTTPFPGCGTTDSPVMRPFSFCEDKNGTYWGPGWGAKGDSQYSISNKDGLGLAGYQSAAAELNPVYSCTDIIGKDGSPVFTEKSPNTSDACAGDAPSSSQV